MTSPRIPLRGDLLLFDVQETPSHYLLRLDVHSVLGNEIILDISGETLTVRECATSIEQNPAKRITLRVDSHQPAVSASYRAGVLLIALPKNAPPSEDGYEKRRPAPLHSRP